MPIPYLGHALEDDDKTLSDYNIQKEATLDVIERVLAPPPPPLEAVAAAASAGEIVAIFAHIAASVAAVPPTITISKVALIAAYKTWREEHDDEDTTEQAAMAFGEALTAFGDRDAVNGAEQGDAANGAGGDAAAVPITTLATALPVEAPFCTPLCTDCEEGEEAPSTHHCAECDIFFCDECLVAHAKVHVYAEE